MKLRQALLAGLLGLAAPHVLACYTVYDSAGRVVYNEETPPVDMSRPLHETLPNRFPGGHMVFDTQASCGEITPMSLSVAGRRQGSPLLTHPHTARAMNAPYTPVGRDIALVQSRDANVRPGVTVVPAEAFAQSPPGLGAVITELRDPPLTIIERDGRAVMGAPPR